MTEHSNHDALRAEAEQTYEALHQSKTRYLQAQAHLKSVSDQAERNRASLELARQEAETLNREWKQLLKENHGKTNPAVTEKLRASRDARDVAEELGPILEAVPEIQEAAEAEAITAREAYLSDLAKAKGAMLQFDLDEAARKVQEVPEFFSFIHALSQYLKHFHAYQLDEVQWLIGGGSVPGRAFIAEDLKAIQQSATGRTCAHLMDVMRRSGLSEDVEELPHFEEIPESPEEQNSPVRRSPIKLKRARDRLALTD